MSATYNWSSFYGMLCRHGPNLLVGIDEGTREIVEMHASGTDMFWSEGLEECLAEGAAAGDLRRGVLSALILPEEIEEMLERGW